MTENSFDVQPLSPDDAAPGSQTLAVAVDLPAEPPPEPPAEPAPEPPSEPEPEGEPTPTGRVFDQGSAPVADGAVYTALDGSAWFRPTWRVADRAAGLLAGPDVWFDRDAQGAIRLRWTLTEVLPAGGPANATSLVIAVSDVTIRWNGGSRSFSPQPLPRQPGPRKVELVAELLPDEARELELAMCDAASGCHLEVTSWCDYNVRLPQRPAGEPRILTFGLMYSDVADRLRELGCAVHTMDVDGNPFWVVELEEAAVGEARRLFQEWGFNWVTPEDIAGWADRLIAVMGEDRFWQLSGLAAGGQENHAEPTTHSVAFVFNPNDDANRPIYRALHGAANLTDTWQKSAPGWLRASPFPNTIYRLPDEVRLAFDPDMGTPHVVSTLHTDAEGRSSVRVLLRVAAWQDPRRIAEVRALTGSPAAQVIVGPVASATLRLGGSFPEEIRLRGNSGEVELPLSEGADLLLELSLEYFQLLCDMLTGAVGLSGDVEVRLDDASPPTTAHVPVSLRMDKVNDLPVAVQVPPGAVSPTSVQVTNRSGAAIRTGGCAAVFLQLDSDSVVPKASYPARCTTPFPLELAAGATADLTFEPTEPHPDDRWNAVLVELLDKQLLADARTTLLRAHELAGTGELTWDLTVSSPVFDAAEPQPRWATLANIEVEVSAPGFDATTVVLRRTSGSRTITLRKPLAALVSGGATGVRTVSYRVRNNYVDHQGEWSTPQQQSGEELIVFPNP